MVLEGRDLNDGSFWQYTATYTDDADTHPRGSGDRSLDTDHDLRKIWSFFPTYSRLYSNDYHVHLRKNNNFEEAMERIWSDFVKPLSFEWTRHPEEVILLLEGAVMVGIGF